MLRLIICGALLLSASAVPGAEMIFDFGAAKLQETPAGFRSTVMGTGGPGDWKVILDDAPSALAPSSPNAPNVSKRAVLAQLSRDRADERSPLLIYEGENFGDFKLTTRFKLVAGESEQMAGIAFRIQDENNYYYIRSSALGGTFYFFKVVGGVRSAPIGAKVEIPKGVWHEMTIATRGNEIRASLNGRELILPLGDKSFLNGKIGFWTKSDSVSYFADTRVLYTTRLTLAQSLVNDALKKYPRLLGVKIFAAPDDPAAPRIIASVNPAEVGQPGTQVERDVLSSNRIFYGKEDDAVLVTMPLHDSNGDTVAAVKFVLKSFPGQTEKNAIGRVMPTLKLMEARVPSLKDLVQ